MRKTCWSRWSCLTDRLIGEEDVRQLLGLGGDEMALELVGHIIGKSVKDGIATVNSASEQGTDLRQLCCEGTLEYLRALLLIKTGARARTSATPTR